ncbi:MAG: citrate synthase family protein [Anaerolineae bacterium]|nr:citrate synthase family protein [Anaerolineae bacterium]
MAKRYLTAQEAAAALDISPATLYAYVSRGLIRSETAGNRRQRRYYAEDIDKLLARKEARKNPEATAREALHWGTPVLESALTLIAGGQYYYRGHNALHLAQTASLEDVAALLWTGEPAQAAALFGQPIPANRYETMLLHLEMDGTLLSPVQTLQAFLPLAAADDPAAYDLRPATVARTGARILRLMTAIIAGETAEPLPLARALQRGWSPQQPEAAALLNTALILCADHELNVSSFTARVVASAGSTPYAVVSAGLSAMQGVKHGGYTGRVEALLREAGSPEAMRDSLAARLQRGEAIPGFGHKLYPEGDPRARLLLELLAQVYPEVPEVRLAQAAVAAAADLLREAPAIDLALVALTRALGLPDGTALALFALGRAVGWIGHAIEQYAADTLIRPRARYVGQQPDDHGH